MGDPLVLDARDIRIEYAGSGPAPFLAVEDFNCQVRKNERVIIIGPSGCGKTTALMAMAGFVSPASGTIQSLGLPISGPGPDRPVVFQAFDQLFPWRTLLSNVAFALRVTTRMSKEEARDRAYKSLAAVGLASAVERYPHELSGGMKQRGAIARAFAVNADLLLMDEPFGALDAITRAELQATLMQLCEDKGAAIVFVTHSIEEAIYLGDKVIVMESNPGRIREVVDTHDIDSIGGSKFDKCAGHLRDLLVYRGGDPNET